LTRKTIETLRRALKVPDRAAYMREYRQRRRDEGRPLPPTSKTAKKRYKTSHKRETNRQERERMKRKGLMRPFVGCDGE
jgi:Tfp pilus assembly protein PilP